MLDANVVVGGAIGAVVTADTDDEVVCGETEAIGDCIMPPPLLAPPTPPPQPPLARKFEFMNAEAFEKSIFS